ncbi:MAG: acylphosphatase [Chthoniobacterales bacterium]
MARVAKRIFYEGKVQGVGFRFTIRQISREYDVTGTVKNLADGRVELALAGEDTEVEAFMQGVRESVLAGHIKKEDIEVSPLQEFRGFQIIE